MERSSLSEQEATIVCEKEAELQRISEEEAIFKGTSLKKWSPWAERPSWSKEEEKLTVVCRGEIGGREGRRGEIKGKEMRDGEGRGWGQSRKGKALNKRPLRWLRRRLEAERAPIEDGGSNSEAWSRRGEGRNDHEWGKGMITKIRAWIGVF